MQGSYYIIVEGPIGVGKTTLVQRLAERLPCRSVYEVFEENPFLASFYQDRSRYAFQTEMFFLLSRFRQQEAFAQAELFQPYAISDYLFEKSRLFARETLPKYELGLFDDIFKVLCRTVPRPDLVVYLHAPLPVDGHVDLDFNVAYNPPCAFTEFATCPIPPGTRQWPPFTRK